MRSSFRFLIAVAPGCERFSAPIFALVTNTRSLFIPKRTTTLAFRGLFIRTICTSTTQRRVGGSVSGANFWFRLARSSELGLFCSRAIPRDAFVSHYIEMTRRTAETADALKSRAVGDVLRDPIFGIALMIQTMNEWLKEFAQRPDCLLVRYEDLQLTPNEQFRRVLAAVGETDPQARHFENALEFSRFGNMRKMEASLEYDRQLLQPGDVNDPESYKVRRGKIGGYVDYLDPSDIEYADQAMAALDRRFGYQK